jgi:hypothetical protein
MFPAGCGQCPECGKLPPPGGFRDTVKCGCGAELTAGTSLCGCGIRQPELIVILEPAACWDPPGRDEC